MTVCVLAVMAAVAVLVLMATGSEEAEGLSIGTPPPEGVTELVGIGSGEGTSLVELADGSLLLVEYGQRRISTDGGETWSDAEPLSTAGMSGTGILRLNSGALALSASGSDFSATPPAQMWISNDEAETWSDPLPVDCLGLPLWDTMIQLRSGRLLVPSRICYSSGASDLACAPQSRGVWRGEEYGVEGHGHCPEIDIAAVSRSDDLGASWERSDCLMGWFDERGITNGHRGHTSCDEPNVAECADGRVLFMARSQVGRLVYSYSDDEGATWSAVRPTELASSFSPPRLRTIPQNGDLLCVWNQVSAEEIRRGYRRGRLSAAISTDSGRTWGHFKTIEVSEGLADVDRVAPDPEIRWVRGRDNVGQLPDNWAYFHYANVRFAGDKVFLMYLRGSPQLGIAEQNLHKQEHVIRIYPLEWFYE